MRLLRRILALAAMSALTTVGAGQLAAEPTSGVDAQLFRPSFDANGLFSVESGEVMPKYDFSLKFALGYGQSPFSAAVPGIGGTDDVASDKVLDFALGLHITTSFSITDRLAIGLDAGLYRTDTDEGYGVRGLYREGGQSAPSSGLISLRPLSNIDQSGTQVGSQVLQFERPGASGPFDARLSLKYRLIKSAKLRVAALGTVHLPFGDDQMFLGDSNLVFEPKVAADYRFSEDGSTRVLLNVGARFRERTVLEAYNSDPALNPTLSPEDAQVVFDLGSELVVGGGITFEALPQVIVAAEVMGFKSLPTSTSYGTCRLNDGTRCTRLDYFGDAGYGDLAAYTMIGVNYRATPDTSISVAAGAGLMGKRNEDFRLITGLVWSPTPAGTRVIGRGDRDSDGVPDARDVCPDEPEDKDKYQDEDGCPELDNDGDGIIDASDSCPNEPEDKDGYQDDDGCPERDNDGDNVPDVTDRCPDQAEDVDQFEDDDGCPDEDNDGDGVPDKDDKCPNKPETVNGFQDTDGCPDSAQKGGPELMTDRIDLRGSQIAFASRKSAKLTPASKTILTQIAQIMNDKARPVIRIEVHVALGTKSKNRRVIARVKRADTALTVRRVNVIAGFLASKRVSRQQIRTAGLGSRAPRSQPATNRINTRVEFIRVLQAGPRP